MQRQSLVMDSEERGEIKLNFLQPFAVCERLLEEQNCHPCILATQVIKLSVISFMPARFYFASR